MDPEGTQELAGLTMDMQRLKAMMGGSRSTDDATMSTLDGTCTGDWGELQRLRAMMGVSAGDSTLDGTMGFGDWDALTPLPRAPASGSEESEPEGGDAQAQAAQHWVSEQARLTAVVSFATKSREQDEAIAQLKQERAAAQRALEEVTSHAGQLEKVRPVAHARPHTSPLRSTTNPPRALPAGTVASALRLQQLSPGAFRPRVCLLPSRLRHRPRGLQRVSRADPATPVASALKLVCPPGGGMPSTCTA